MATVRRATTRVSNHELEILLPSHLVKYIVETGSVAVDGVSLTVARLDGSRMTVALIPRTWEMTTLQHLRAGAKVNIEVDIIGKYVEKFFLIERDPRPKGKPGGIDRDMLVRQGFGE